MTKKIVLCVAVFQLAACATLGPTGYQQVGFTGGYSDTKIQEGIYRIEFKGNKRTSEERASNLALLRASEVALENGYNYFILLDGATKSNVSIRSDPNSQSHMSGNVSPGGSFSASTYSTGGGTYSVSKPQSTLVIQCYKKKPNTNTTVFNATEVKTNISSKYSTYEKQNIIQKMLPVSKVKS